MSSNRESSIQRYLRQPSSLQHDSFVFAYPVIFESKFHREHESTIRDFIQLQFLNQIKNSNILRVVNKQVFQSDYSNHSEGHRSRSNPAVRLGEKLHVRELKYDMSSFGSSRRSTEASPYLQDTIDKVIEPLAKMVKHDPKFSELNSIIDLVPVAESDVFVPLVIGTKVSKIQSDALFWIFYFALGHIGKSNHSTIALNDRNNLNVLSRIFSQVNSQNYSEFFNKLQPVRSTVVSGNINYQQVTRLKGSLAQGLKRFEDAVSQDKYQRELSIGGNNKIQVSLADTLHESKHVRRAVLSQSSSLNGSLLSSELVPVLHSLVNMLMSADELTGDNTNPRMGEPTTVSKFVGDIVTRIQSIGDKMNTTVTDAIESQLIRSTSGPATQSDDSYFKLFGSVCGNVDSMSIESTLQELSSATFSASHDDGKQIELFVQKLSTISSQLKPHINYLVKDIIEISLDSALIENTIKSYQKDVEKTIRSFMDGIVRDWDRTGYSDRLLGLIGVNRNNFNTKVFLLQLVDAMVDIALFFNMYTYVSYLCQYFSYVHAEVEKVKETAFEFPNYTLVVDADIIKLLYTNLAVSTFKKRVKEDSSSTKDVLNGFEISEQHLMNMVRKVAGKLKIPNIVVIDGSDVYYQFMFHRSGSIQKISMSNIKSFNRNFKPSMM